jgi:hypothetical protein
LWGTDQEKKVFGEIYRLFYGKQEERNYAKGIKVVKRLASNGYVPAVFQLGVAYFDHLGVHRNYNEAFRLYMEAAKEGYPSAACGVGNFYTMAYPKHHACEYDPDQAVFWWIEASKRGNASAQYNLANYYLHGTSVKQDLVEAYVWASLAVHCSTIRFIPAEVTRDKSSTLLDENARVEADLRIGQLKEYLPYDWSEHNVYWKILYEAATALA